MHSGFCLVLALSSSKLLPLTRAVNLTQTPKMSTKQKALVELNQIVSTKSHRTRESPLPGITLSLSDGKRGSYPSQPSLMKGVIKVITGALCSRTVELQRQGVQLPLPPLPPGSRRRAPQRRGSTA